MDDGFAFLDRGRTLAQEANNAWALLAMAASESDALLKLARFQDAADVALRGLGTARQAGLVASSGLDIVAGNACEALLAVGRTAEAAALIDPLTAGPPDRNHWLVHEDRAEIDLLRGDTDAATRRLQEIDARYAHIGHVEFARESARRAAELALWDGRPSDALNRVQRVLPLYKTPDQAILSGRLLLPAAGVCRPGGAGQGAPRRTGGRGHCRRRRRPGRWAGQVPGAPFADHPFVATIPAERATWDAEWARLAGASDPGAWRAAAEAWQDLGCPHRAGYAWWRRAQAQLDAGQPPTAAGVALRAAAAAADGHAPLLAQVRGLAERARVPLQPPAAATAATPRPAAAAPYGLTGRELAVLRLLAAGRTNAQIGAELYISPRTAGVHVTNILRKLEVSSRVQAAAQAERAGLLPARQS